MTRKILIITVGGSCEPIVTTITELEPDYIYFICSDDNNGRKGSYISITDYCGMQESKQESIKQRLSLHADKYEIIKLPSGIEDDINEIVNYLSEKLIQKFKEERTEFYFDFTGGTKSMSAGLILIYLMFNDFRQYNLFITTGVRRDLVRVANGTQQAIPVKLSKIYYRLKLQEFNYFIEHFQYSAAVDLLQKFKTNYKNLDNETRQELMELINITKAFDYWDKFNHEKASDLFKNYSKKYGFYIPILQQIIKDKECLKEKTVEKLSYNIVEDLFFNIERSKENNRFDDAVARGYRLLELLAQITLANEFGIFTDNVEREKIKNLKPECLELFKATNSSSEKFALLDAYRLLKCLNSELGKIFSNIEGDFMNILQIRNKSILAHGFMAIDEKIFSDFFNFLKKFYTQFKDKYKPKLKLKQLPKLINQS